MSGCAPGDSGGVERRAPTPAASAEAADWLLERVDIWHGDWVTGMVGAGFDGYARLFHPPTGDSAGTWADVAQANGRMMHPSAEWEQISAPGPYRRKDWGRSRGGHGAPRIGEMDARALHVLWDVLARHTSTPHQCYFALWEGWGTLQGDVTTVYAHRTGSGSIPPPPPRPAPAEWQLVLSGQRFPMPARNEFYLFEGDVHAALRIGAWPNESVFHAIAPQFIWPGDHAWCVATEIDHDSTFVGGTQALVEELCASTEIEVLQIAPDAPALDRLNP
jgi:hypothetical protein